MLVSVEKAEKNIVALEVTVDAEKFVDCGGSSCEGFG